VGVARSMDGDPILEAYRLWMENGWEDCAAGLAAVTSIIRVRQVLSIRADQVLAPIDLTFSRYELLVHLYFNDGRLSLAQLGKRLQVHQTSVTSLVDKLEAQGLIRRTPHPTDRRSTIAQITPEGRALTGEAITRLNSGLFRDLGLTGEEVGTLISVLTKMRRSWGDFDKESEEGLLAIGPGLFLAGEGQA
jgi:DNA-binding MarR family transcriptional regulator